VITGFLRAIAELLRAIAKVLGASVDAVSFSFGGPIGELASVIVGVRPKRAPHTYEARMSSISARLSETTQEAQALFNELESNMAARKAALDDAEVRMASLAQQEAKTAQRIKALEGSSPEAAAAFHQLLDASLAEGSRRSNRRDLVIFLLGIVASIIVQVVYGFFVGDIKIGH